MKKNSVYRIACGILPVMFAACFTLIAASSCSKSNKDEAKGYECLSKARDMLSFGRFDDARASIDELREKFPLAFNAREEGILLLDSIELECAKKDLQNALAYLTDSTNTQHRDSMEFAKEEAQQKIRFYTTKLENDKTNFEKH